MPDVVRRLRILAALRNTLPRSPLAKRGDADRANVELSEMRRRMPGEIASAALRTERPPAAAAVRGRRTVKPVLPSFARRKAERTRGARARELEAHEEELATTGDCPERRCRASATRVANDFRRSAALAKAGRAEAFVRRPGPRLLAKLPRDRPPPPPRDALWALCVAGLRRSAAR